MSNIEQATSLIRFYMRQMNGGLYPERLEVSPALAQLVDADTAQHIYRKELDRLGLRSAVAR